MPKLDPGSGKGKAVLALGFLLHLILLFPYVASGLLVPAPIIGVLLAIWLALFALAIYWRKRPWRVLAIPGIAIIAWFTIVQGGSWIFGWTA